MAFCAPRQRRWVAALLWLLWVGLSMNALAQAPNGTTVAGGNGPGSLANQLSSPFGVAVDGSGNVYVADRGNSRVQKWAPGATSGTTVAGGNGAGSGANQLNNPSGVAVDASGNVYVADEQNHRIQKWAPLATSGTTVAGGNGAGSGANQLYLPSGVYVDASGNVYVADYANNRIQKWAPFAASGTTVAGGSFGSGDNQLYYPTSVYVDGSANVYVADLNNNRIQKWAPGATSGTTVAGGNGAGSGANQLSSPFGVAVDGSGNVYVTDRVNSRVQKWGPGATSGTTVAGGNGFGGGANQLNNPLGVALDASANVYVADQQNHRIQKFSPPPTLTGLSASPNPVCAGSSLTFTATVGSVSGAYSYTLTNGLGSSLTGTASTTAFSQSLPASGSGSQSFTLTITSASGTVSASTAVTVNPLPDAGFSGLAGPYCADAPPLTVVPTTSGGQFSGPGVSGTLFTPANAGTGGPVSYSVSVGGCSNTSQQNVTVNPLPTANLTNNGPLSCTLTSVTLTATGGGTYQFSAGATQVGSGNTATVNTTGTYSVTVTSANGCTAVASTSVMSDTARPSVGITLPASASSVCEGGTVSVVASITGTPSGYQWFKDGQSLGATQQSPTLGLAGVLPAQSGSYVLVTTGACGATSTAFNLTVKPLPTVTLLFNSIGQVMTGGNIPIITLTNGLPTTFQVLGGAAYQRLQVLDRINGYEIRQVDTNATGVFTVNKPGPYSLTVTDANGCSRTVQGEIR